ncbi:unnamed protein product [Withania somnifera]
MATKLVLPYKVKVLVIGTSWYHSIYTFIMSNDDSQRNTMVHNQIWISISRHRTAKGNNQIVDKSIELDQVDRESNWEDQIIFLGLLYYIGFLMVEQAHHMPIALHHHFLYSRYHSRHHSYITTKTITPVIHPFADVLAYVTLFHIYIHWNCLNCWIKRLNHFNFCPQGDTIFYTTMYHSLHHIQFRTNYSLFMPMYDLYGTVDKSSDTLSEKSLEWKAELPDVVYLTHLTTPESIYHLRLGFASLAHKPQASKWYFWLMWPTNLFRNLKIQTWAIPKYSMQYFMRWQRDAVNNLIEEAIMEADQKGKVLSLGLLNQAKQLNSNGELYIRRNPQLKVKVVDGSSLAVAVVLSSIPKGTSQVVLRGRLSKVAYSIALVLCQGGIQVAMLDGEEYKRLKARLNTEVATNLACSKSCSPKLVGDGLRKDEQLKAPKETSFIRYSQFPPRKVRKDCVYFNTPAMIAPKHFENVDSCENWLPRRVMSPWRIAGILHALEGWNEHECGDMMLLTEKVWKASLRHVFSPITKISVA